MFFKRWEEAFKRLEGKFQALEEGIASGNRKSEELGEKLAQLQTAVKKNDMAMEDLLEEWGERQSDEQEVKERFREYEQREEHLLQLFEAYQEQFFSLKRFAKGKDEAWAAQIALMEKNLERCRQSCGIDVIEDCDVEVNYDLHEVIETVDTEALDRDGNIADIYRCGYRYGGKVKRKAQVSAYRAGGHEPQGD